MLTRYTRFFVPVLVVFLFLTIMTMKNGRTNLPQWVQIPHRDWTPSWAFEDDFPSGNDEKRVVHSELSETNGMNVTALKGPKQLPKAVPPGPSPYAFVFYATEDDYACGVLVNIDRLVNIFRTRHRIFVLVSKGVSSQYLDAFRKFNTTISIEEAPKLHPESNIYYSDCLIKLLSFKLHQIDATLKRVVVLDSDQLILRNLDHVFELPPVDLAAPRAYWIGKDTVTSSFMVINLSNRLWALISDSINTIQKDVYDMEIVNKFLGKTVMVLPGSYVALNSHWADWNMPDWFRPEEVKAMDKQGRATGDTGLVRETAEDKKEKYYIGKLGWAVNGWKEEIEKFEYEMEVQEEPLGVGISKRNTESDVAQGQAENAPNNSGDATSNPTLGADQSIADDSAQQEVKAGSPVDQGSDRGERQSDTTSTSPADMKPESQSAGASDQIEPSVANTEPPQEPPVKTDISKAELNTPLYDLHRVSHVLHFSFGQKPWWGTVEQTKSLYPDTHPLFLQQWSIWREVAQMVCPGTNATEPAPTEDDPNATKVVRKKYIDVV